MKVWTDITKFKAKKPVVTIGSFDGVHLGHIQVLNKLNKIAEDVNGESVIITFSPHPARVLHPNKKHVMLTTLDEKIVLLEKANVKHLIILEFNIGFSKMPYDKFVYEILVKKIGIHTFLLGYDNKIGKNKEGNFEQLKKQANKYKFNISIEKQVLINNDKLSSTQIRKLLNNGELLKASELLGYPYILSGKVVNGQKIGNKLGFPTANISPCKYKFIPANGVYAVKIEIDEKQYIGMLNIGVRPTLHNDNDKKKVTIETHIFDFDKQIYNKQIKIYIIRKLRDEQKFETIDDLSIQLHKDKKKAIEFLLKKDTL